MDVSSKKEVLDYWDKGWTSLFDAITPLTNDDLERIVYIRNMGHTIIEAINRQLAHYAYHVGQIVYLGRMMRGAEWISLSIPKGASASYNANKFNQKKSRTHFSEEFIDKKD